MSKSTKLIRHLTSTNQELDMSGEFQELIFENCFNSKTDT